MSLHAAVLGTGDWSGVHLRALSESAHVGQVTLAGRNQGALQTLAEQFPIVQRTSTRLEDPLEDDSVDVVHVVLPHFLHGRMTREALAAGKHVICEKPAAISLDELDGAIGAAESAQRRLLVVMNQLYNPVYRALRELVIAGAVGRPFLSVENSFSNASANYRKLDYWRNTTDRAGGGILIDGAFHMVYRHVDTLADEGPPVWVQADTAQLAVRADLLPEPTKGEDFASIAVGFERPLRIQWAHGWTLAANPARSRQSFLAGTEGTLELTDREATPLVLRTPEGDSAIDVPAGPRSGRDTTHACLLDYLESIAQDRPPRHGGLDLARQTLAIILAAYRSGRDGVRVGL